MSAPLSMAPVERTLVWDLPVRVFHWLLALSVLGAYATGDSERWRLLHTTLGYTAAGLIGFRIVWGLIGSRHARFASFLRGPRAVARYLRSLLGVRPEHHVGHNPAAGWMIVALLLLGLGAAATGWATYEEVGGPRLADRLEDVHEALANTMIALVAVHVLAAVASSLLHRENLILAMLTGRKPAPTVQGIHGNARAVATVVVAAVLGFWWQQWDSAPASGMTAARQHDHDRDHDDD